MNELVGTKMKILTGYQGQNEINLAAERGEVQGNNTGLSNLTVNKADWLAGHKVRILLQFGTERLPAVAGRANCGIELTAIGMPTARHCASTPPKFSLARPLLIPPDVPADRVRGAAGRIRRDHGGT